MIQLIFQVLKEVYEGDKWQLPLKVYQRRKGVQGVCSKVQRSGLQGPNFNLALSG